MQRRPRGPQFARPADQRVVIGDYEAPERASGTAPAGAGRRPTLLARLRARFRGEQVAEQRGPAFEQPPGAARIGRYVRRRNRSARPPAGPTGFERRSG